MVDQNVSGSLDMSVNEGSKSSQTPKDKACPFCQQQFTSSSLGRHLDLYIKEKNPKPADGIHDIDEIRKLRGGITRRQPRSSTGKREHSIISTTSGAAERRSPRPDSERGKIRSPSSRREEGTHKYSHTEQHENKSKMSGFINRATWKSTGVINNIPTPRNSDARNWDGEEKDNGRRFETRTRSVNKKILAKANFDQKQKLAEALDKAKAAGLALRELVGSLRAAKQQVHGTKIFDFDPLAMDFPSLCLHCLPPPPTLHTNTPIPSPNSWALTPPEDAQYQALCSHFTATFHRYRVSLATSTAIQDQSYTNQPSCSFVADSRAITTNLESSANSLECKVSNHLQAVFRAWQALPLPNRSEIWTISLARSINIKSSQIECLKRELEGFKQEAAHLKQQVDDLSRLQHPREFRISQPQTVRIDSDSMATLDEWMLGMGVEGRTDGEGSPNELGAGHGISLNILDQNVPIDAVVERAIVRWRNVVKEARKHSAVNDEVNLPDRRSLGQQSLSRDGLGGRERLLSPSIQVSNDWERSREANKNMTSNVGVGSDADADADMEEEDGSSYVEMIDAPPALQASQNHLGHLQQQHLQHPQHYHQQQQQQLVRDQGYRQGHSNPSKNSCINAGPDPNHNLSGNPNIASNDNINNAKLNPNNNNSNRAIEGMENQVVGGYVRIGA